MGRHRFDYDAVEEKKRRRPPRVRLLSEDKHLQSSDRRKLVATARDARRNQTIAAWMIRKHLDYVSTFSFQARTEDKEFNTRLEELMRWWSRPRNFDAAGRHSRQRYTRLAEAQRTLDGDFFTLKLSSGMVQGIEGDRIRTPELGTLPEDLDRDRLVHGIEITKTGRARRYCLCNRREYGGFVFDRLLPSRHLIPFGYYDRIDQVRGIPPLASAINTPQDIYEGLDYALAKAKVSQLFVLAFSRVADAALGDVTPATDAEGDEDKSRYEIDFGRGPIALDLDPEDKAEILESSQPSTQFKDFMQFEIVIALKALDIPFSFFCEDFTNYSGSRQALLMYEQSAEVKQEDVRDHLNALTAWRIGLWVLDGVLELPADWTIETIKWEWIHKGIPWIQPLQEIKADGEALDRVLSSRTRILKRQGLDFQEVADERAAEDEYLREKGLPTGPPAKAAPVGV